MSKKQAALKQASFVLMIAESLAEQLGNLGRFLDDAGLEDRSLVAEVYAQADEAEVLATRVDSIRDELSLIGDEA